MFLILISVSNKFKISDKKTDEDNKCSVSLKWRRGWLRTREWGGWNPVYTWKCSHREAVVRRTVSHRCSLCFWGSLQTQNSGYSHPLNCKIEMVTLVSLQGSKSCVEVPLNGFPNMASLVSRGHGRMELHTDSREMEDQWGFPYTPLRYNLKHNLYRVNEQIVSHLFQTSIMESKKQGAEKNETVSNSPDWES